MTYFFDFKIDMFGFIAVLNTQAPLYQTLLYSILQLK